MPATEPVPLMGTASCLQEFVVWGAGRLERAGVAQPKLDAELLAAHVLNTGREALWREPARILSPGEEEEFCRLLVRREMREPLAYITGEKEFWSRPFQVTSDVLIPRPDTETLIELLLEAAGSGNRGRDWRILDVGCGSGILAVTAACELPESRVMAFDISEAALDVTQRNASALGVDGRVTCERSNGFQALKSAQKVMFDFILTNPPYLSHKDLAACEPEILQYEPRGALDGGRDGLDFYRMLIPQAPEFMKPGGWLLMEIGAGQGQAVCGLLSEDARYTAVEVRKDAAGNDRVVRAQRGANG